MAGIEHADLMAIMWAEDALGAVPRARDLRALNDLTDNFQRRWNVDFSDPQWTDYWQNILKPHQRELDAFEMPPLREGLIEHLTNALLAEVKYYRKEKSFLLEETIDKEVDKLFISRSI